MQLLRPTDPAPRDLMRPSVLVGSLGLVGFSPVARGTAGTALCLLAALGLYFAAPWHVTAWLPLAAVCCVLSWLAGALVLKQLQGLKDPGWFVMDEAAGFFLALGLLGADSLLDIFAGFLIFRFYDIAKPWPVRSFERISGSEGARANPGADSLAILLDDLAAAVFAAWTWSALVAVTAAVL